MAAPGAAALLACRPIEPDRPLKLVASIRGLSPPHRLFSPSRCSSRATIGRILIYGPVYQAMDKGRLEAFSDGVIAIIITIMVLKMKLPLHARAILSLNHDDQIALCGRIESKSLSVRETEAAVREILKNQQEPPAETILFTGAGAPPKPAPSTASAHVRSLEETSASSSRSRSKSR
jgi:HTH domain found in ParB protein/Endosomal/lysosomal potassium channel TMEM175